MKDATQLEQELAEARAALVSGFYEDEMPTFRQGAPTHELESLVTAEEVTDYIKKILELHAEIERLKREVDNAERNVIEYAIERAGCPQQADDVALRKDAARYRWLSRSSSWPWVKANLWQPISPEEFDAAIDAALEAK